MHDHDAFGDGLFRGSKETFVEPDRMSAGCGVERPGDFQCMKTSAHHPGSEFADAPGDGTGDEDFHDLMVVVVDGHIEILSFESDLPSGAVQLLRPVLAIGIGFEREFHGHPAGIKTLGLVQCTNEFGEQPQVVNGFSELMAEVFGEDAGVGARSAVGMGSLPSNIPVEIECIFEVAT